jgi:site-specific DNA-methyltransferase (adenine-specific)
MTCKSYTGRANINIYHGDCMEFMKDKPAKSYELAICDPPYGVNRDFGFGGFGGFGKPIARTQYKGWGDKSIPDKEYFENLLLKAIYTIIWGGNFFAHYLPKSTHWIFWDKKQTMPTFGDGEIAYTNIKRNSIKKFEYQYNGLLGNEKNRIHSTQKPVALYKWLLTNYAKPNDKILDTHGGSMSIAIACWDLGFDLDIIELDKDYYDKAVQRFERHINQKQIF